MCSSCTTRNRSVRALGHARLRVFASSTLEGPGPIALDLARRCEMTVSGEMVARQVGTWHLHGASVEILDPTIPTTVQQPTPARR
jgi:hypothetical protein